MKSLFTFSLILTFFIQVSAQRFLTDSLVGYPKSFSYGVSNLIDLHKIGTDYRPMVYFEYAQKAGDQFYYFAGVDLSYKTFRDGNIRHHEFIPFVITLGGYKLWTKENLYLGLGGDLFYSMSVRKTTISTFQSDDYGVGVAPRLIGGIALRENLSLEVGLSYGVGFFRVFQGVGTITTQALQFRVQPVRNLSFGIKQMF